MRVIFSRLLLVLFILLSSHSAKADYWTYIYLMYNGFQCTDMGKSMQKVATNMALGMMTGTETGILNDEGTKLKIDSARRDEIAEIFDNIGVRASSDPATNTVTVELDKAIEFGDITDKTLQNALKQAEALKLDPTNLQAMGQSVKATARAQAFDQTLRAYEQLGGQPMTLNERKTLQGKLDTLKDEQLNETILLEQAKAFAEASRLQQENDATRSGMTSVEAAMMTGETILKRGDEFATHAVPIDSEASPDLYKYAALGGIRRLGSVVGTNPITGEAEIQQVATTTPDEFNKLDSAAITGDGNIGNTAYSMIGTSTANIPGTQGGNMGCAAATSMMFKQATGQDILPGRSIVLGTGELYNGLSNDSRFVKIPISQATSGDLVVTARNGARAGHTGVVGNNGQIISNSSSGFNGSARGTIQQNYSIASWQQKVTPRNPSQTSAFRYIGN